MLIRVKSEWRIYSWKAFSAVWLLPQKSFLFLLQVFLSFLGVLVSISKGQVSARTIQSLRLESTLKSGKLICMSKIVCSQADIQSKWLKELLAVKDVSWRGKEWKQTRLLGKKNKGCTFWTSPCWVTCWPWEILNSVMGCFLLAFLGWCQESMGESNEDSSVHTWRIFVHKRLILA